MTSNSIVFKNLRTGKVETLNKDEIETIKWMKRSRGYGLKFITKSDSSTRFDGFKDTVSESTNQSKENETIFLQGSRTFERIHDD